MGLTADQVREFAASVIRPAVHPDRVPLEVAALHLPGEPCPAREAVAGVFSPFRVGDRWGGMWSTTWFRFRGRIPPEWAGREVAALVHLGGARSVGFSAEGLVFDSGLRPVQGLHHEHREVPVSPAARGGEPVEFYVEAAANPIPRWHVRDWPRLDPDYDGAPLYALEQAELASWDRAAEALWFDVRLAADLAERLPERSAEVLEALGECLSEVVSGGPGAAGRARAALAPVLSRPGPGTGPGTGRHTVVGVGHAHIDSAWLWPVRETRRKCARTFANQLRLLERYPEHHFVCSQAVQYQWLKDGYPDLFEQVRAAVAAGRWEPVGGMWVEADSNIPSGESLVRQFVHGKRFFLAEFGVEPAEMWIPDVFGYSAALPQIAASAGVTALITQKMSWSDTNEFPHSTFVWEGHDGSRVLAHFPPADTYNGEMSVADLLTDAGHFKDADRSGLTLYPYGYGDGGGGPTAHMLEAARRLGDLEGLPRLEIGSVGRFLERVRTEDADLPVWVGELYLEAHRATSTTHADVKLANRRAEEALRAAEMWSVGAGLESSGRLDPLWKLLLLNQFHDIIPGSSIGWVYRDAAADHAAVLAGAEAVAGEARDRIVGGSGPELVAFNPSSYDRCELVELPDGRLEPVTVPGCGWAPVRPEEPGWAPVEVGDGFMDNGVLRVAWDDQGLLTSVWDHRAGREVLAEGERGNLFQLHEDHPRAFDAWDVDREYLERFADLTALDSMEVVEQRRRRADLRLTRRFGGSTLTQVMRLSAGSRRIEFRTEVDWQERHRFLKVAFPVAVRSARATYEIQHGHIERPTVENTSWDVARFEVWAHRWAHLGEPGYGVALLNDCKYGYDIRGHTLRLSLLRGPGYPDPDADRGHHRFAYALLPHPGDLRADGRVVEEAEAFNLPLEVRPASVPGPGRVMAVDRPGVSVEAVKWADDGDGVVVRLCEVHGSRGRATVTAGFDFASVHTADVLERRRDRLDADGRSFTIALRPFELVTLRLTGGPAARIVGGS
ncbi:MAG TPA: glycoside hydrolase family 38 C-terminal domain-containing protein [Acidimicrobiales bacterium]|nr:glycoside hydrolase family 38 C-terminal domain-containing protein [Acidimicrobiales bacterium]